MTEHTDEALVIEQRDRELFKAVVTGDYCEMTTADVDSGNFDMDDRMQSIARHRTTDAARIAALEDLLCLADELLMDAWVAYPIPGNPNRERMAPIRAVTGKDYRNRKDRAARATLKEQHQ